MDFFKLFLFSLSLSFATAALSSEALNEGPLARCEVNLSAPLDASFKTFRKIGKEKTLAAIKASNVLLGSRELRKIFNELLEQAENSLKIRDKGKVASISLRLKVFQEAWSSFAPKNTPSPLLRGEDTVMIRQKEDQPLQRSPLREIFLPLIATGAYLPNSGFYHAPAKAMDSLPDSIVILLPGIGSTSSHAQGLLQITSKLAKADPKAQEIAEVNGRKHRTLPIALDSTINGMALGAPGFFSSADVSVEMLHHVVLLSKILFPGLKIHLAGRSQGGLQALEYASRYSDVSSVISLNPSVPSQAVHEHVIRVHGDPDFMDKVGMGEISLIDEIWQSYIGETMKFSFHTRTPLVPVHVMLGNKDISYGDRDGEFHSEFQNYRTFLEKYRSEHPNTVQVRTWENAQHDMWSPAGGSEKRTSFQDAVSYMSAIFAEQEP